MKYVIPRGQTLWFSRALPGFAGQRLPLASGARRVGRNGYLRFSLRTGNRREAERLARRYAVEVDDVLEHLAKGVGKTAAITPEDIRLAAAAMETSLLSADEDVYRSALEAALSGRAIERAPDRESSLAEELPPPSVEGDAELLRRLRAIIPFFLQTTVGKVPTGPVDARYAPFGLAFRRVAEALRQRAEGKQVPTPSVPQPNAKEAATITRWEGLLDYYQRHHKAAAVRTVDLYRLALRELASFAGGGPADLTRKQVIGWRDALTEKLAPKTALTRLAAAKTVYAFCLVNEKLGERRNPFEGITVPGAKTARSRRKGYSLAALKEIFRDPPALDDIPHSAGKHAALWIPLLALFTGARREELAGLLTDDVGEEDDIEYLHFRDNRLRKLKRDTCERRIPLHSEIIRLGFPAYVRAVRGAGAERLFPGVVRSDGVTDWFTRHVEARLGETEAMQDLHSFRHTFKTAARNAGIITEIHDALTGHATPGVGSQYGSPAGIRRLKAELDKITYPGVEFTAPPVPTVEEIKATAAGAERRRRVGQQRAHRRRRREEQAV